MGMKFHNFVNVGISVSALLSEACLCLSSLSDVSTTKPYTNIILIRLLTVKKVIHRVPYPGRWKWPIYLSKIKTFTEIKLKCQHFCRISQQYAYTKW